jgi:hypothetical protein
MDSDGRAGRLLPDPLDAGHESFFGAGEFLAASRNADGALYASLGSTAVGSPSRTVPARSEPRRE